nr:mitochondrial fad-linked sulfhydryl oxidase erv1 [Quercus suber]
MTIVIPLDVGDPSTLDATTVNWSRTGPKARTYILEGRTGMPAQPLDASPEQLAKGDAEHSRRCRTCTSVSSWQAMIAQHDGKKSSSKPTQGSTTIPTQPADCPPDVEQLGRSSWTLLHSITAQYPERPSFSKQIETKQFLGLFGKMYPCWVCAEDFQAWMKNGNEPRVSNREEFGKWMCEAHNAVNTKLGKPSFDCNKWEERWRTGWKDGRCD